MMEQHKHMKEQYQKQIAAQYSLHPLFDIKTKTVTDGLCLASCNPEYVTETEDETSTEDLPAEMESRLVVSEAKSCNTCQVQFNDRDEQLVHYKSDWHRYNLHLRLKEAQPVTEEKFETMLGDVSSISGSDDDEESDEAAQNFQVSTPLVKSRTESPSSSKKRNSHKVFFTNTQGELISVHRCLLHHKKNPIYEKDDLVAAATELSMKTKWAVLMVTSGHFAGAIFDKNEAVEHKTFHRYTVRKKRGSAQSSHDSRGQHANSAGANLRRYNEAALTQEVQELLAKWKDLIRECNFIFMRVPVANRGMFYAGKSAPLQKDDERIRVIPFPTRRPTFSELKRVHQVLASVECFGKADFLGSLMPRSPQRVYDKQSGQLQVKDPTLSPRSKGVKKKKSKVEIDKQKGQSNVEIPPVVVSTNAENQPEFEDEHVEEEEGDIDLVEETVVIDLNNLKEFEASPKKRQNKKKVPSKIEDFSLDEREIRWRNSLFASSKNGNETIFNTILNEIVFHYKENGELITCSPPCDIEAHNLPCEKKTSVSENESIISNPVCGPDNQSIAEAPNNQHCLNEKEFATACSSVDNSIEEATAGESDLKSSQNMWPKQVVDFLNRPLGDGGQTLLHSASKEGQAQMVHLLLESGADPAIKDKSGKLPYNLGSSDVRNAYRRFMSLWPNKYDYAAAQIPSPLTEEMEAERKKKNAEKRKAKKKAANERNKEKKAAEALVREEEEEKNRFLALSEREKRALAAERRLMQQHNTKGTITPALSRCWQCGLDITGKVPFEYNDFKFCTTKCLREHRSQKR